jgi:hypothetical protein
VAQILNTGYQRAAKTSQVIIGILGGGGTALAMASWAVDMTSVDLPTVNFNSYNTSGSTVTAFGVGQTFDEGISGVLGANIDFGGDWDAHVALISPNPPGLYPRDDLQNVQLVPSRLDSVNQFWDFLYMRLRTTRNGCEVNGKVTFAVSGKNQGPFTPPENNV